MTESTLKKRVDLLETKVDDQFKILKDNNIVIEEMVRSTLDYLEGLGKFLKYAPSTFTAKELGYGKEKSNKGDKKDV